MKVCNTILAVLLGAAFHAAAAPTNSPPASAAPTPQQQMQLAMQSSAPPPAPSTTIATSKPHFTWFPGDTSKEQTKIYYYGNLSSRPWAETVGWHPGQTQFADGENQQSQLVLFQFPWGR
ncbi:MAG: hypothetical protein ACLQSR_06340 [Limisphaerales bacterium]